MKFDISWLGDRRNSWVRLGLAGLVLLGSVLPGCRVPPRNDLRSDRPDPAAVSPTVSGDWSQDFKEYAVAADHAIASAAGAEILAAGGNAVDAAVATSFTLSVVRPFSCGIGGGGFMVIHRPAQAGLAGFSTALNYRETTPGAIGPTFYGDLPQDRYRPSLRGGTAAGVPGTVAGLYEAHWRYGQLAWARCLEPAIRVAEAGFTADKAFVGNRSHILEFERRPELKQRFAFLWQRYLREGDLQVGDLIRNPEQGLALRLIAERGPDAFYRGEIARAIARTVQADGGVMTLNDLRSYQPRQVEPIEFASGARRVLTMPPPSSGGIALAQIDGVYQRLLARFPEAEQDQTLRIHLYLEASKHAFADRSEFLADPAFVEVPTERLLSGVYLDGLAARVDPTMTGVTESYGTAMPLADDSGTSHFSIVDSAGMAVACTETINTGFGSFLAVEEFGFILNNEMDDFTTQPGVANAYGLVQSDKNLPEPGKRPLSSMTPTIVLDEDGQVQLITGASGGPRIISVTTQTVLQPPVLGQEFSLANPTLHHQWLPDVVRIEPGVSEVVRRGLGARGHELAETSGNAVAQTIRRVASDTGRVWRAASDPRKGGLPAGN